MAHTIYKNECHAFVVVDVNLAKKTAMILF
jgi:hypothetical protein